MKNPWIIGLAAAVVVGGAVLYMSTRISDSIPSMGEHKMSNGVIMKDEVMVEDQSMDMRRANPQAIEFNGSLRELVAERRDLTCDFSQTLGKAPFQGTVFTSSGKLRGDFTMSTDSGNHVNHVISDATDAYSWSSDSAVGEHKRLMDSSDMIDMDVKFAMRCSEWTPDTTSFALPAGVSF